MTILNSGFVGVGTNAPASLFQVNGVSGDPSTANSLLTLRNDTSNIGFQMGAFSNYGWIRAADVGVAHLTWGRMILGNDYVSIGDGADDNQFRLNTTNGAVTLSGTLRLKGYTVATLPTGTTGMIAYVTDATAPTYRGTLTGGGAVVCQVFFDGSVWRSN